MKDGSDDVYKQILRRLLYTKLTNLFVKDSLKRELRLREVILQLEERLPLLRPGWDESYLRTPTFENRLPDYQKIVDQMNERDPDPTEVARRQALWERFVRRGRIVSDFLFHNYLYNPLPETKPRKRSSPKDREARSTFEPKHLDRLVRYRMSVAQEALDFPISKNIPQE